MSQVFAIELELMPGTWRLDCAFDCRRTFFSLPAPCAQSLVASLALLHVPLHGNMSLSASEQSVQSKQADENQYASRQIESQLQEHVELSFDRILVS